MGIYASSFRLDEGMRVDEVTSPSEPDWITAHAAATSLAIVEIERLWYRFHQLGANNKGVLVWEDFEKSRTSQDPFMKNMLTTLRDAHGNIPFQSFLNAMKWAEISEQEIKIRAVFSFINNGNSVDKDMLFRVLAKVYDGDSEESVKRTVNLFFQEMDKQNKGFIEKDQFVMWVQQLPQGTLDDLFNFHIIPPAVNQEAHRTFTSMTKTSDRPAAGSPVPSQQIPSNVVLEQVAHKVHMKDWALLANKLGFTAQDIAGFHQAEPKDSFSQVYTMLQQWSRREGTMAHAGVLETALRQCKMNDAAMLLYP